jgi:asparagine N-glycosylation enzyme membrane subunit Stt3
LIADRRLQVVAAVSGIYDALVGVTMLLGRSLLVQIFNVPPPVPPIHADLNGIFLLAIAAGYLIPYREPRSAGGRAYLWIMGPLLKGTGAALFVMDYYVRHSPSSFLLFAVSVGTLALITLWALVTTVRPRPAT